jgi:hypothetical protein
LAKAYYSREYPQRCFAVLERHGLVTLATDGNSYSITDAGRAALRVMSSAEYTCERCACALTADYFSDERCNTGGIGVCLCETCAKYTATLSDEAFAAGDWRLLVLTGAVHVKRPSFTHEELEAMWHTLSPAGGWQALGLAVAKLDAYMALYRATRGTDGR